MPTHHYITTEPPISVFQPGKSGTAELRAQYTTSPLNDGTYTDSALRALYTTLEFPAVLSDGGHYFGSVNREYTDAPNLASVAVGGAGLPATPFAPNPAAPTDPGLNPASIPALATPPTRGGGGAFQGDGLASPSATTARIGRQRLGNLIFGTSTPATI